MATAEEKRRRATWRWIRAGGNRIMPYADSMFDPEDLFMINGFLYFLACIPTDFEEMLEDDLNDVFMNTDEFAINGRYRRNGGSIYTLAGIFDDPYQESVPGLTVGSQSQEYTFKVQESDIVGRVGNGDTILICGVNYKVIRAEPDGVDVVVLILHRVIT